MPAQGPMAHQRISLADCLSEASCMRLTGRHLGLDVQAADQPSSATPASPKLDTALSQSSPTQAKPIVRSAAGTSGHAPADAGADMQFSMSMQPEASGARALAGAEREVGAMLSWRSTFSATSPSQALQD